VTADEYALAKGTVIGKDMARREIRRAIAGRLRKLRSAAGVMPRHVLKDECPHCRAIDAVEAIDAATRAPRKAKGK
jgi:hypothetical protein